jgi:hypothetical protein
MLAIVIPYYKYTFFEATLVSLSNQTDKRFKLYIGDDASPEIPSFLLEKYESVLNFDYKKFDTNIGETALVKQWERCVQMVDNEEWVMILGDDDTIGDNCVASFYAHITEVDQQKINVIRYATVVIDQNGEDLSGIYLHPTKEKGSDFLIRKFEGGTRSSLSEYVFRKSIVQRIGFKSLPLGWHADLLAVLEFSDLTTIYTINSAVVYFRISGLNITSRNDNLVQKNIASFQFYHYLLNEKSFFFDKNQKNILCKRLERTFLDNKKNVYFWLLFTRLYMSNFYIKNYFVFISSMLKSIYIKINK